MISLCVKKLLKMGYCRFRNIFTESTFHNDHNRYLQQTIFRFHCTQPLTSKTNIKQFQIKKSYGKPIYRRISDPKLERIYEP